MEVEGWIEAYARRRYGNSTPPTALVAWDLLLRSVYNATDGHTDHSRDVPTSRPGLSPAEVGLWGLKPHLWYNEQQVTLPAMAVAANCSDKSASDLHLRFICTMRLPTSFAMTMAHPCGLIR